MFIKHSRLEKHVANGNSCKVYTPHPSAENLVLSMYIDSFGMGGRKEELRRNHVGKTFILHLENLPKIEISKDLPRSETPLAPLSNTFNDLFSEGWGLPAVVRERTTFSKKQETYIEKIFQDGRKDKKKSKAVDVAEMMRRDKKFTPSEWLTESQVIKTILCKTRANILITKHIIAASLARCLMSAAKWAKEVVFCKASFH